MIDYANFDDAFGNAPSPYSRSAMKKIESRRNDLGGVFFIDRVIMALGVSECESPAGSPAPWAALTLPPAKIYPPKSDSALRAFHQQVCEAEISVSHRLSILYYIMLDFEDNESQDASDDAAERFARQAGVPAKYQTMMRGLWYMDHQLFEVCCRIFDRNLHASLTVLQEALEFITHPSLTPDFADSILMTLIQHAEPTIALQYYHTVRPILNSSDAIAALFAAISQTSVSQAFFFSRTFPEHTRQSLLHQLVASVLGQDEVMANGHSTPSPEDKHNAERTRELALLPFDSVEEAWFESYLEKGEGRKLQFAKDVLVIRRVARGRFDEAKATEGLRSGWSAVLEGLN
jgi:hypothetical protein